MGRICEHRRNPVRAPGPTCLRVGTLRRLAGRDLQPAGSIVLASGPDGPLCGGLPSVPAGRSRSSWIASGRRPIGVMSISAVAGCPVMPAGGSMAASCADSDPRRRQESGLDVARSGLTGFGSIALERGGAAISGPRPFPGHRHEHAAPSRTGRARGRCGEWRFRRTVTVNRRLPALRATRRTRARGGCFASSIE